MRSRNGAQSVPMRCGMSGKCCSHICAFRGRPLLFGSMDSSDLASTMSATTAYLISRWLTAWAEMRKSRKKAGKHIKRDKFQKVGLPRFGD